MPMILSSSYIAPLTMNPFRKLILISACGTIASMAAETHSTEKAHEKTSPTHETKPPVPEKVHEKTAPAHESKPPAPEKVHAAEPAGAKGPAKPATAAEPAKPAKAAPAAVPARPTELSPPEKAHRRRRVAAKREKAMAPVVVTERLSEVPVVESTH